MKRIRAFVPVVLAALCWGALPGTSNALPFTARVIPINASGVSDVVFESGLVFGSQMQSGKVFVVDPTGGAIVTTLTVDVSRTHTLAADTVAHRVYVTNYDTGTLSVIDSAANPPTVLSTSSVGARPIGIDVDTVSHRVFIGLCCEESRTIVALDGTVSPPATIATVLVGQGPDHLAVDSGSGRVYVANYDSSSVSVVEGRLTPPVHLGYIALPKDTRSGRVLRPNALAVNPATNLLYVSAGDITAEQHQIEVYDTTTSKSVASFPTGQFIPADINVDATKNVVWFTLPTNRFGNFYSVLGDRQLTLDRLVSPHASVISPNFANFALDPATSRAFGAGQDSIVVMEDDSVAPVAAFDDELQVAVHFTYPPQAITHITGTATDDNSGVAAVMLRFDLIPTDTLAAVSPVPVRATSSTMFAVLKSCTGGKLTCAWDRIPGVNPGLYSVHLIVIDAAGNRNADDPTLTVLVV